MKISLLDVFSFPPKEFNDDELREAYAVIEHSDFHCKKLAEALKNYQRLIQTLKDPSHIESLLLDLTTLKIPFGLTCINPILRATEVIVLAQQKNRSIEQEDNSNELYDSFYAILGWLQQQSPEQFNCCFTKTTYNVLEETKPALADRKSHSDPEFHYRTRNAIGGTPQEQSGSNKFSIFKRKRSVSAPNMQLSLITMQSLCFKIFFEGINSELQDITEKAENWIQELIKLKVSLSDEIQTSATTSTKSNTFDEKCRQFTKLYLSIIKIHHELSKLITSKLFLENRLNALEDILSPKKNQKASKKEVTSLLPEKKDKTQRVHELISTIVAEINGIGQNNQHGHVTEISKIIGFLKKNNFLTEEAINQARGWLEKNTEAQDSEQPKRSHPS